MTEAPSPISRNQFNRSVPNLYTPPKYTGRLPVKGKGKGCCCRGCDGGGGLIESGD